MSSPSNSQKNHPEKSSARACLLTVNWNQADKTIACLRSAAVLERGPYPTILIDNGSSDQSAEKIRAAFGDGWEKWITMVELERNLGFAGAYNIGLRMAIESGVDFVLLINNDVILDPASLTHLLAAAEKNPTEGLWTAKIYYEGTNTIWTTGANLNHLTLELRGSNRGRVDEGQFSTVPIGFAPLCGVLIRTALLEEVGFLDEGFFVYYEDMDFARRIVQSGWGMRFVPEAIIWHAVSASSGGQNSPAERYWMGQGSGRYFRKHASPLRLLLIILPYRLISAIKTTVKLISRGRWRAAAAYWLGLWRGWTTGRSTLQPPHWVSN